MKESVIVEIVLMNRIVESANNHQPLAIVTN